MWLHDEGFWIIDRKLTLMLRFSTPWRIIVPLYSLGVIDGLGKGMKNAFRAEV